VRGASEGANNRDTHSKGERKIRINKKKREKDGIDQKRFALNSTPKKKLLEGFNQGEKNSFADGRRVES
jgi:hypothetical protein